MMRSKRKSKRVSWPSDVNLCQVRLFLSEDSPSQVGLGAQENLQVKASWLLHSAGAGSEGQLPPGFERGHSTDKLKIEAPTVPLVKWQCSPRFVLNPHWQVVAAEESKEAQVQKQREMGVLEAIYPRPSAIPPSPSVSSELEDSHNEDHPTPLIPVTPIEDEDMTHTLSDSVTPTNSHVSSEMQALPVSLGQGVPQKPQSNILTALKPLGANEKSGVGVVPGVEPDVVAAASAAFTAIMRSNEQGSLIDHELLIKILSNPKLIEKLITDYGTAASSQTASVSSSLSMSLSVPHSGQQPSYMNRNEPNIPLLIQPTPGLFHPVTNVVTTTTHPSPPSGIVQVSKHAGKPPPVKDINYYKSLIQQHGGEKLEAQEQVSQFVNHSHLVTKTEASDSSKIRESKSKNKRPCIYFKSSRGCKHGAKCVFYHDDESVQQQLGSMPEAQGAKRMKLDREIAGGT